MDGSILWHWSCGLLIPSSVQLTWFLFLFVPLSLLLLVGIRCCTTVNKALSMRKLEKYGSVQILKFLANRSKQKPRQLIDCLRKLSGTYSRISEPTADEKADQKEWRRIPTHRGKPHGPQNMDSNERAMPLKPSQQILIIHPNSSKYNVL